MALDYTLLVAIIGVPLGVLMMRLVGMIALLHEISASLWMLPL
ncbi:MAG: hypothetical protein ACU0BB_04625 [Paracoccaceae bacterium]